MTTRQKLGYVLNEWMVAWLFFYAMIVVVMILGMMDGGKSFADLVGDATIFAVVTAVMLGPFALVKWLTIRRSKRRTQGTGLGSAQTAVRP